MRPTDKPKYEAPAMKRFASADDLFAHYAKRGDPRSFAKVLQFTKDCEAKLSERTNEEQLRKASRRR